MSDVRATVCRLVAKVKNLPVESVSPEASFDELDVTSLDALSLLYDLEEELGVMIPDENAPELNTVADLVGLMEQLVASEQGAPVAVG